MIKESLPEIYAERNSQLLIKPDKKIRKSELKQKLKKKEDLKKLEKKN